MSDTPALLTRRDLAKALHVSTAAVDKLTHRAKDPIPHIRAGRRYLFRLDSVLAFLEKLTRKGGRA